MYTHTSHITHHTSHITHHTSHITHHTSHITHHTSHITHHTSNIASGVREHRQRRCLYHLTFSSVLPSPSPPRRSIAECRAPVSAQMNRCCSAAATTGAEVISLKQSLRVLFTCNSVLTAGRHRPSRHDAALLNASCCRCLHRLVAASLKVAFL